MSHPLIGRWQGRLRRRRVAIVLALAIPIVAGIVAMLQRWAAPDVAMVVLAAVVVVLVVAFWRAWRSVDEIRVVRALDATIAEMQDSSDLLLRSEQTLNPLEVLQRARILGRLEARGVPDLRSPWPGRSIVLSLLAGIAFTAAALFIPSSVPDPQGPAPGEVQKAGPASTSITRIELRIEPPAYTALPASREGQLDARVIEGSRLHWSLQFDPPPTAARLRFHDGTELALDRNDEVWSAGQSVDRSLLYRVEIDGAPALAEDAFHRLDAIADRPPEIRVVAPEKTLNQHADGQATWLLDFEVTDDFGVTDGFLDITLAQGSGEQVEVSARRQRINADTGSDGRVRRFRRELALGPLGLGAGDDLIVHFEVGDNRAPKANRSRSPAYILRWPADASMASEGVEGIVQKVLPAYFRSQRQIIIDTEALIAERAALSEERFMARSDTIGVDQKILRLRYGQFLGEEFESGGAGHAEDAHDDEDGEGASQQDALQSGDEHAGEGQGSAGFGRADDVLEAYGHTHDHVEAATLLDPETKKILKAALDEMWQAELHLRQGAPRKALPYENRALGYIKQVQQSTRIYLARVGLELPPVDPGRRLTGERDGVRDPRGILAAAIPEDVALRQFYLDLSASPTIDLEPLDAWIREHEDRIADPLGLIAATDALRRDPDCASCRGDLLDRLWAAMPARPAQVGLRAQPDALGDAYLDALRERPQP